MKSDDLQFDEIMEFGKGDVRLLGRRLVIHDLHATAQMRQDLVKSVGADHARRILTRFGYAWGQADAAAMKRVFVWDSLEELLKAGARLHSLAGKAQTTVSSIKMDEATGRFEMNLVWRESAEAEEQLVVLGSSRETRCWISTGYASGYASFCLGRDIYFVENKCRAKGDRICSATGRDAPSWGVEAPKLAALFKVEDIQGKIRELTRELRRRTRELAAERQQREQLTQIRTGTLVEVRSVAYQRILDLVSRIAPYDTSALITGESGVGKEVVARTIHSLSRRAQGPFVAVNCCALPETLLDSELFGHKAGAFTGATQDRVGLFEQARKGTIFLDEIGDVSPALQVKLLRVLQEKEIMRVGESATRKTDARVIAATNKNLEQLIAEGKFREDLFYRLRVIEVAVPPLREHPEDILPLARNFVSLFEKELGKPGLRLEASCLPYLEDYAWPGNIRELRNAIEHAAVLSQGARIRPEYLPPSVLRGGTARPARLPAGEPNVSLAELEQQHILAVLNACDGHRARAAQALGISAATLWRKLNHYKMLPGAPSA